MGGGAAGGAEGVFGGADGEADAAGTHEAGFLNGLVGGDRFGVGGGVDVDVVFSVDPSLGF